MAILKKRRRRAWNYPKESICLRLIGNLFIRPLLKHCPDNYPMSTFLGDIFNIDTRHIIIYTALSPFNMPGLYMDGSCKTQGIGYRHVRSGQRLLVRHDTTRPSIWEASFHGGVGEKELVYELDSSEWLKVSRYLEVVNDCSS